MIDQHDGPACLHSELAVGWALHTLEPAEEILVATHLPDCSPCSRIVAETEQLGAVLGLSVPVATPSAELERRVLALTSTAQALPEVMAPAPSTRPEPPVRPKPSVRSVRRPATRPRRPAPRRRRREPICVPEILKLLAVALLTLAFAVVIVFYFIP